MLILTHLHGGTRSIQAVDLQSADDTAAVEWQHSPTSFSLLQMRPLGFHNSSFATKRGVQTPVKSNPLEAAELNDLVNFEVSDGSDEGI